jgi:hypothetical protein
VKRGAERCPDATRSDARPEPGPEPLSSAVLELPVEPRSHEPALGPGGVTRGKNVPGAKRTNSVCAERTRGWPDMVTS